MSKKTLIIKSSNDVSNPTTTDESAIVLLSSNAEFRSLLSSGSSDSFDEIIVHETILDDSYNSTLFKLLKPSSKILIDGISDRETGQQLALDLKIEGFIDIMTAKDPSDGRRFLVAQKPTWNIGASARVDIPISSNHANKWTIDNLAEEELVDENELLAESAIATNAAQSCGDEVNGKKRACANCTCGLADEERKDSKNSQPSTTEEKIVKASSCGNCYKGDAFRCASCPFLGKPVFEPGQEKLVLSLGVDDI